MFSHHLGSSIFDFCTLQIYWADGRFHNLAQVAWLCCNPWNPSAKFLKLQGFPSIRCEQRVPLWQINPRIPDFACCFCTVEDFRTLEDAAFLKTVVQVFGLYKWSPTSYYPFFPPCNRIVYIFKTICKQIKIKKLFFQLLAKRGFLQKVCKIYTIPGYPSAKIPELSQCHNLAAGFCKSGP